MDARPIGVFDSGYGGLTAVRSLPEGEDVIFFGDNGRAPYGGRSREELRLMTRQALDFLAGQGVKLILAACGTVSCTAGETLRDYAVPSFGVAEATLHALEEEPPRGSLGLIATEATVRSGVFQRALGPELKALACPELVTLVEQGHSEPDDPRVRETVARLLRPMRDAGVKTLILGCTHFGLLSASIGELMGAECRLVEASRCAAEELQRRLRELGLENGRGGALKCFTSGDKEQFSRLSPRFLGRDVDEIQEIKAWKTEM